MNGEAGTATAWHPKPKSEQCYTVKLDMKTKDGKKHIMQKVRFVCVLCVCGRVAYARRVCAAYTQVYACMACACVLRNAYWTVIFTLISTLIFTWTTINSTLTTP